MVQYGMNCTQFAALALLAVACASDPSYVEIMRSAPPGQAAPVEQWLARHPDAAPAARAEALAALCEARQRAGRYAEAAQACAARNALVGDAATPASRQAAAFYATLGTAPPMHANGVADIPLTYSWTGMAEAAVTANGVASSWGVDTGAEITTITESDAQLYGARLLAEPLEIHGSTPGTTAGKIAVIDLLAIGAAEVRNVPAFVVPDAAMTARGQRVPPILGLPVLMAFERIAFREHATRLVLGAAPAERAMPGRISWNTFGIAIAIGLHNRTIEGHLDTGANLTELHEGTIDALSRDQRSHLVRDDLSVGGVTGTALREVMFLRDLDVRVGSATCRLEEITFGPEEADAQGRIGIDLVKACQSFAIDFSQMRFSAE